MDLLKSAASLLTSRGSFPYEFDSSKPVGNAGIWRIFDGKDTNGNAVSVWQARRANSSIINATTQREIQKLKTTLLPGTPDFLSSLENSTSVLVVTERLVPLHTILRQIDTESVLWGILQLAETLTQLVERSLSVHMALSMDCIFVSRSGDWKLGLLQYCFTLDELKSSATEYKNGSGMPLVIPPEIKMARGSISVELLPLVQAFGFGPLVQSIFKDRGKQMPQKMSQFVRRLAATQLQNRIPIAQFIKIGSQPSGFFSCDAVKFNQLMRDLHLLTSPERELFFEMLEQKIDSIPVDVASFRLLPRLKELIQLDKDNIAALRAIIDVSTEADAEALRDYAEPALIISFQSQDRVVRRCLLEHMNEVIKIVSEKTVNDKLFANYMTGLGDNDQVIRDLSVRAIVHLAPKLSPRKLNNDLLRALAATQMDREPQIRTNTTICLAKIADLLDNNTRKTVLVSAFMKALRDPFAPARNAALQAFSRTIDLVEPKDCAQKILPAIAIALIDNDRIIRERTRSLFDICISKIDEYAQTLPTGSNLEEEIAAAKLRTSSTRTAIKETSNEKIASPKLQLASNNSAKINGTLKRSDSNDSDGSAFKSMGRDFRSALAVSKSEKLKEENFGSNLEAEDWAELDDAWELSNIETDISWDAEIDKW